MARPFEKQGSETYDEYIDRYREFLYEHGTSKYPQSPIAFLGAEYDNYRQRHEWSLYEEITIEYFNRVNEDIVPNRPVIEGTEPIEPWIYTRSFAIPYLHPVFKPHRKSGG